MAENYAHSFSCFTLKSNILAQDSDQLSLPHSINLLFGSFGLRSIPILDRSQIWSLQPKKEEAYLCILRGFRKLVITFFTVKNIPKLINQQFKYWVKIVN